MSDAKTPAEKPKPATKKPAAKKPTAPKASGSSASAAVPPVPPAPVAAPAPAASAPATPPPAPPYAGAPAAAPVAAPLPQLRPEEERNVAMLSHLISLLAILLSASWISALIFYLIYKDRGPFVRQHTATELNFQLTMIIAAIAGGLLAIVLVGFLVLLAIPVVMIVFGIISTMRASEGQPYEYPLAIKFVR
jgi:uncharacterized Tic20 family protein